jgi:hypothetical protein
VALPAGKVSLTHTLCFSRPVCMPRFSHVTCHLSLSHRPCGTDRATRCVRPAHERGVHLPAVLSLRRQAPGECPVVWVIVHALLSQVSCLSHPSCRCVCMAISCISLRRNTSAHAATSSIGSSNMHPSTLGPVSRMRGEFGVAVCCAVLAVSLLSQTHNHTLKPTHNLDSPHRVSFVTTR